MKRIAAAGLAGWTLIVALAWWLADQRIGVCDYSDGRCELRAVAARDTVLVHGLTVALVALLALAFVIWVRNRRMNPANHIEAGSTGPARRQFPSAKSLAVAWRSHLLASLRAGSKLVRIDAIRLAGLATAFAVVFMLGWSAHLRWIERTPADAPVPGHPNSRSITVRFTDGTSHVYQNVPDTVTPQQAIERAQRDSGKAVVMLDFSAHAASDASSGADPKSTKGADADARKTPTITPIDHEPFAEPASQAAD
jgi:hypothetical protein